MREVANYKKELRRLIEAVAFAKPDKKHNLMLATFGKLAEFERLYNTYDKLIEFERLLTHKYYFALMSHGTPNELRAELKDTS